jgi:hypothetical protein
MIEEGLSFVISLFAFIPKLHLICQSQALLTQYAYATV